MNGEEFKIQKMYLPTVSFVSFRRTFMGIFYQKEAPLIVLDRKYVMCMDKNGRDTKHTINIARRIRFVRNGEKCKMHMHQLLIS